MKKESSKDFKKKWPAEKRMYEKLFYAFLKRKTRIIDIDPSEDQLGYTSSDGYIHLAQEHPTMNALPDETHKAAFRYGVFTHETLHQIFSDFKALEQTVDRHSDPVEKRVLALFANLVEDPAIEYFAPTVFGGEMLAALRYSIKVIYDAAPGLAKAETPFTELIWALTDFGDMGLVKGRFKFKEARESFLKIAPEFNRAVENPCSKERIEAAERWTVMTRPLWKKEAEEMNQLLEAIEKIIDSMRSREMRGRGSAKMTPKGKPEETSASKRRSEFASIMEKLLGESGESGESGEPSESDKSDESGESGESSESDGRESGKRASSARSSRKSKPKSAKPKDGKDGKDGKDNSDGSDSKDGKDGKDTSDGSDSKDGQDGKDNSDGSDNKDGKDNAEAGAEEAMKTLQNGDYSDFDINAETVEDIWDRITDEELSAAAEEKADTMDIPVPLPKADGGKAPKVVCYNTRVEATPSGVSEYKGLVREVGKEIRVLSGALRRMFIFDIETRLASTSGRYILKKDLTHTSVRVFDKKIVRDKLDDLAVFLLVDMSGSMRGTKIDVAKRTAIVLAESFASLKIPCYIMGFTADEDWNAGTVNQYHFVSWKNTPAERASLSGIAHKWDNDDGYSIRYAAQVLKRKPAEHKILFVISDGSPACMRYDHVNGIEDTTHAILEAKKIAEVFGIGIGSGVYPELKEMYGGNYLMVRNVQDLTENFSRQMKTIVNGFKRKM